METSGWEGFILLNKAIRDDNSRALEKLFTGSDKMISELSILCIYTEYAYRSHGKTTGIGGKTFSNSCKMHLVDVKDNTILCS